MPTLNGKEVQFVATSEWNSKYGGLEMAVYMRLALQALQKHPVDMLIFEQPRKGRLQVRSAGYFLNDDSKLDETTVILTVESLDIDKFWLKIDDYGDRYVATFLFPHEY